MSNEPENNDLMDMRAKHAKKMLHVMNKTQAIKKSSTNTAQKYNYAGAASVDAEVRVALVEAGLAFYMYPVGGLQTNTATTFFDGKEVKTPVWHQDYMMHLVDTESGYDLEIPWSADSLVMRDDKHGFKMATSARKTFFVSTFAIPTKDIKEVDQNPSAEKIEEARRQKLANDQREKEAAEARQKQAAEARQKQQVNPKEAQQPESKPVQPTPQNITQMPQQPPAKPTTDNRPPPSKTQQQQQLSWAEEQKALFFTELTKRGFDMTTDAGKNSSKEILSSLGFTGKYDPLNHDAMLEALDLYLDQRKNGMESSADKFDQEFGTPVTITPAAPMPDDDFDSGFEFNQ